ncbi:MAG: protein dpnD [Shewanella vesiculosa]|uniref:DpnD/PcfM family protein n=1 Tax=Shewanella vesiculosa TaxID=518738 RepID=UPI000CBDB897|nr:DpnD/PcfM family protein [Shewanella vesiculosa]NCP38861.1 protein dpnD [Shewanella vesiculosa]PIV14404.1 MAG: protein dpnD [Gallionellales bacterium CG03_land_8_20_14_0_80_55_15]PIX04661.1 MAG: protein dpnD [Gallionellales bacterium CG_4_8_14_3_um_filter_54_18]HCJ51127.1 protein dpnD [Gallionella sp.]
MKTFEIEIKETLSKIIEIQANSIEDAIKKATLLYNNEEIILSSDDYLDTEIESFTTSN